MTTASIIILIASLILFAHPSRKRFPVYASGIIGILGGSFILALSLGMTTSGIMAGVAWIWFCFWTISCPALLAAIVAQCVLARSDSKMFVPVGATLIALVANVVIAFEFWGAASMAIVSR